MTLEKYCEALKSDGHTIFRKVMASGEVSEIKAMLDREFAHLFALTGGNKERGRFWSISHSVASVSSC